MFKPFTTFLLTFALLAILNCFQLIAQNTQLNQIKDYPTYFFYDSLFNLQYEIKAKNAGIFSNGDIYLEIENEENKNKK